VTSPAFSNTDTFYRHEEFCLLVKKLIGTFATKKAATLTNHYPTLSKNLAEIEDEDKDCSLKMSS
jgi:hypothetical protein